MSSLAPAYRPRRPTESVLYRVVRESLETFLAHARESYESPLPRYVEKELRGYLRCGIFAHGFIRAHCDQCGHDLLVAFSCKARSVCPSCAGRRMANTAANLVDRVLPAVAVRQWVLSLPWDLRALAAFKSDVLSALVRMFVEAIFARYQKWATSQGAPKPSCGAITHVQRFGSSLNLNVHFHVMVLDGVFTRDQSDNPKFHCAPSPTLDELDAVVRRVRRRAIGWLQRKGYLNSSTDAYSTESSVQTSIDACAAIAMGRGIVKTLCEDNDAAEELDSKVHSPLPNAGALERDGFNVHASVVVAADDDLGRERLMRYGARPPLALDRLRRLPGGRIAYKIKSARGGRAKYRVIAPLEFMARLAALVPPPRYPLLRYHGVLAPRSPWRREIVPRPREIQSSRCSPAKRTSSELTRGHASTTRRPAHTSDRRTPPQRTEHRDSTIALRSPGVSSGLQIGCRTGIPVANSSAQTSTAVTSLAASWMSGFDVLAPNIVSVKHWNRLLGGQLYAASPRIDWARLLRRCFDVDVLNCPTCGGRLRVLSEVTDPTMIGLMLEALGLPTVAPRAARARDPTELGGESESI